MKEGICADLLLPTHEGCCRGVQGWDPSRDPQGQQGFLGGVVASQGRLGVELLGYKLAGHQGQQGECWDNGTGTYSYGQGAHCFILVQEDMVFQKGSPQT